jgi:hypothetical protein
VRWKHLAANEVTWEPEAHFNEQRPIQEFWGKQNRMPFKLKLNLQDSDKPGGVKENQTTIHLVSSVTKDKK